MTNGREEGLVLSGIPQRNPICGKFDCTFNSSDNLCEGCLDLGLAESGYRKSASRDHFIPTVFRSLSWQEDSLQGVTSLFQSQMNP